jgi:hypothetical protein
MKKIFLMCILAVVAIAGYAPAENTFIIPKLPPYKPYEALFNAQAMVESSNNPNAFYAPEKATGLLQITPIRLRDYNNRTGKGYQLSDCYDPKTTREIWQYYASEFSPYDYEGISRAWNCNSYKYWLKVKEQLKSELWTQNISMK